MPSDILASVPLRPSHRQRIRVELDKVSPNGPYEPQTSTVAYLYAHVDSNYISILADLRVRGYHQDGVAIARLCLDDDRDVFDVTADRVRRAANTLIAKNQVARPTGTDTPPVAPTPKSIAVEPLPPTRGSRRFTFDTDD